LEHFRILSSSLLCCQGPNIDSGREGLYSAKIQAFLNDEPMSDAEGPVPIEEAQVGVATAPPPKITTFYSLQNRNYLWFWLSALASFGGLQINMIARGWLVWELTESAFNVGVVSFAFGVPMLLFSLIGGAIADRVRKRNLLQVAQGFQAVVTLAIAILVTTEAIEFWHLVVASACTGLFFSFDGPARQAMIPELVGRRSLLNAIALNSSGMNLMRVVGPTLGGILLVTIGMASVFYIVVGCYVAAVAALAMISPAKRVEEPGFAPLSAGASGQSRSGTFVQSIWADLVEGLGYIRHNSLIKSLLVLAFVPLAFGLPYMVLLPVFADEVLDVGEFGYGMLMATTGVGALIASLGIASMGDYRRKGMLLLLLALGFSIALIGFGLSHSYALSLAILVLVGACSTGYMTLNNTLLQSNVPPRMLGRVMSLYILTIALMPMGALPLGALGDIIGVGTAVAGGGAITGFFILAMLFLRPSLRRLE